MFKRNKWVRHERPGSASVSRVGDGVPPRELFWPREIRG